MPAPAGAAEAVIAEAEETVRRAAEQRHRRVAVAIDKAGKQDAADGLLLHAGGRRVRERADPVDASVFDVDRPRPVDRALGVARDDCVGDEPRRYPNASHACRNASCAGVSVSIRRPSASSFMRAMPSSI